MLFILATGPTNDGQVVERQTGRILSAGQGTGLAGPERVQADADRRAVRLVRRRHAGGGPVRGPGQLESGAEQAAVRGQVGRGPGPRENRGGRPAVDGAAAGRHAAEGRHHQGEHRQRDTGPVRRPARRPGGIRRRAGRYRAARPRRVHPGAAAVGRNEHCHVPAEAAGRHVRWQDIPRQGRFHPACPVADILRRRHCRQAVQLAQLQHRVVRRVP